MARKKKTSGAISGDEWTFDREQQKKKKLQHILKTASACFNEQGYSGTSLRDLAKRLKVTDAALYYYVQSKEELVFLCYMRSLDVAERIISQAATEGRTGLEKMQLYIGLQVEANCGPEGPFAILSELPSLRLAHRSHVIERMNKDTRMVAGFIQTGMQDGSIRECDPPVAAMAIFGALSWIAKWHKPDGRHDINDVAKTFVQVLTKGIAAK